MAKLRIKLKTELAGEVLPRKLSKSEVRQLQIIEKTIQLCASGGYEALSYEKIAAACGVTRHLVIHYFADREQLVEQAMEYVWASLKLTILEKVNQSKGGASEKMAAYLVANLEWARSERAFAIFLILFIQFATTKPRFRKMNTELMRLGQERILGLLQSGIKAGEFIPFSQPELEAKNVQISVLGHVVSFLTEDQPFESQELEQQLIQSVMNRWQKPKPRKAS